MILITFGEIIKSAREYRRLSQEETAATIGKKYKVRISASYLSMIESGVRTNISLKLLNAFLDFFNLPVQSASSLFEKPLWPGNNEKIFREVPDTYGEDCILNKEQLAVLPSEARRFLREFQIFIWERYANKL